MRLGNVIADYRWANRIGVRELAREIGTSHPTLNRLERGENCDAETLTKVLAWLFAAGEPPKRQRDNAMTPTTPQISERSEKDSGSESGGTREHVTHAQRGSGISEGRE